MTIGPEPVRAAPHLLIATVGGRDPWSGNEPTGPLRAAQALKPTAVALLANPAVREQAELTKAAISEVARDADVAIDEMQLDDPSDLEQVSAAVRRVFDRLAGFEGTVSICGTSGTPQLFVAVTLAAEAYFPEAHHYQAKDPALAPPADLFREASPELFRHYAEARAGFAALANCRLHEASALLGRRERSGLAVAKERRQLFRAGRAAADALIAVAGFDRAAARKPLQEVRLGTLPAEAQAIVGEQLQWLDELAKSSPEVNPQWPAELGALSLRQRQSGLAAEALVTAAVALEVGLRVRLRTEYEVDADNPPDSVRAQLTGLSILNPTTGRIEGQQRLSDALKTLDPSYATWLEDAGNDQARESLAQARNKLVHLARRPEDSTLSRSHSLLDDFCRHYGWRAPSACPTAPEALGRLAASLARATGVDLSAR